MTMGLLSIEDEAARFMARYAGAFNALDGAAVSALYARPAGIVDCTGYTHWSTSDEIAVNMIALCAHYRSNGYQHNAFVLRRCIAQGRVAVYADVAWTLYWRDRAPTCFGTGYLLRRDNGDWRIQVCTAYEETLASEGN
jgi:hypothetical protein